MKVTWSDRASRHIAMIYLHIEADSPRNAESQVRRIFEAVDLLQTFPAIGRPAHGSETRQLVVPKTPYVVTYKLAGNIVEIVAVLHGALRWPADL